MTKSELFYERQYSFALRCQQLTQKLVISASNKIYVDQLLRSSSSIGANYIEALEGLSKRDFGHRLKICRKEARESVHWLRLIRDSNLNIHKPTSDSIAELIAEANELKRILSASIKTLER
jgi:four helix bundle protein